MKKLILPLLCLFAVQIARADDVAVFNVLLPSEKKPRQVVIEFHEADAPVTVENFKKLARKRFYNGLAFHRVFPRILVQAGDPLSAKEKYRPKVGTSGPGYTLQPEIKKRHVTGAVAMARLPDKINPSRRSNGSQFYICLKPMPGFDGKYTVFGQVIGGMETLVQISTMAADTNDNPVDRAVIKSVKIEPRERVKIPEEKPQPKPAAEKHG